MSQLQKIFLFSILLLIVIGYFTKDKWLPLLKNLFGKNINCSSRFLFIGDSLTAFNQSYADQLKSVCPDFYYKKLSKSGEKTDWMLEQLTQELKNNKYDVVSVWGGINDIYATGSIEDAKINLQKMYDLAKKTGTKVIALTIIPTRTYAQATEKNIRLTNELNQWIKSNPSVDYVIDANKILNDGNDGTQLQYLQSDGLHLTSAGQKRIAEEFQKSVLK